MTREVQQLRGEPGPRLNQRFFWIEARFGEAFEQVLTCVEPAVRLRDRIDDLRIDAEGLARFPKRTARAICGDGRRNRRPIPTVLAVDVLDDFFTPLVLEVDVDIEPWS